MSIVQLYEDCEKKVRDLNGPLSNLRDYVNADADDATIQKAMSQCESALHVVQKARKNLSLEITQVKDRAERAHYATLSKEMDQKIGEFTAYYQGINTQMSKKKLLEGSQHNNDMYRTEGKTNDELLEGAHRVQDLTFDSLGRTRLMVEQSKEIGIATIDELRRQHSQVCEYMCRMDIWIYIYSLSVTLYTLLIVIPPDPSHTTLRITGTFCSRRWMK
jgi:predicted  nucleic acid-binding Zn-ribbon protein